MFDQTTAVIVAEDNNGKTIKNIPIVYTNNGSTQSTCNFKDMEFTNGLILYSGSLYTLQESCRANTGNAGNYYSWPTSAAGGQSQNSICSKGWKAIDNTNSELKSFYHLLGTTYNQTTNKGNAPMFPPLSYTFSGYYNASRNQRGTIGYYIGSNQTSGLRYSSYDYYFDNYNGGAYYSFSNNYGYPLRCGESAWLFSEK